MAFGWLTCNKWQHQMLEKMQKESSCAHIAGGSQNATATQSGRALKNLSMHLTYSFTIAALGIYPRAMKTCVHTKPVYERSWKL